MRMFNRSVKSHRDIPDIQIRPADPLVKVGKQSSAPLTNRNDNPTTKKKRREFREPDLSDAVLSLSLIPMVGRVRRDTARSATGLPVRFVYDGFKGGTTRTQHQSA